MKVLADRFELTVRAAQGAMGSVYRALDRQTGTTVAVKISSLDSPIDRGRFVREADTLALLDHPNVVRYVAHGVSDGQHYLVEEWVEGVTLRDQLHAPGATAAEAIVVARGLIEAMRAAHRLGIVHRDIKPDNIILEGGAHDRVKLVDFGIARATNLANRLTRTGTVIGTPSYMSPEQARGLADIGTETDVWAAGCVLFEMLTGRKAFAGQSALAIRAKVLMDTVPGIGSLCPEAPEVLGQLVANMLSHAPGARPTADEVAATLQLVTIGDGPRRPVGAKEPATVVMPIRVHEFATREEPEVRCFVLFRTPPASEVDTSEHAGLLDELAQRHQFEPYHLDDGTTILATRDRGRVAAIAAAHLALAIHERIPSASLAIVGQRAGDLDASFERGARALERATMGALFGGVIDNASNAIAVDDVIVALISDDVAVTMFASGPVLAGSTNTSG